ncbi:MAG: hypothetical protein GY811_03975 [Myxococcales bacterium]|nr:hypothetical protein [Myxococcales bacterium]
MKRFLTFLAPILLAIAFSAGNASAWEAATTHAGLTEQTALSSSLHKRLQEQFGASQGLYAMLRIPTVDAPSLFDIVGRLNPTHGYVPDASGRMSALSWLALGSVVADVPALHASNHFLDPLTGSGLGNSTEPGIAKRTHLAALRLGGGPSLGAGGQSAQDWWKSANNPLGYEGFAEQFRKAVSAETEGERSRHLAGSLVAAGAMLHILQDMGVPSRVRDDIAAHQRQVGSDESDRGSRVERIAALSFGRLGIPNPSAAPAQSSLASHFANAQGTGLADTVARTYFSSGTLPKEFKVTRNTGNSEFRNRLDKHLRRPDPSAESGKTSTRFDLVAARNKDGATWRSDSGSCLAVYHIKEARIRWTMPDTCVLDQLEAILPTVTGYGVSFLDALYPSDLGFASNEEALRISLAGERYGAGKLRIFTEGADGVRKPYFTAALTGTESGLALPAPPEGSMRITALFDGRDALDNPLLASTSSPWPLQ